MRAREGSPGERTVRRIERAAGGVVLVLLLVTGLLTFFGVGAGTPADDEDGAGHWRPFEPVIADFRGKVEYRPAGALEWRGLEWSDAFGEGDALRTAPDAYCDVLLGWNVGARVQPGSEVVWKRLRRDGDVRAIEVELVRGRVLSSLEKLAHGSRFEVVTAQSRSRVKGTVLDVSVQGGSTTTSVIAGVVEVVDVTNPSRRVEVKSGTATQFGDGHFGEITTLAPDEKAALTGALRLLGANLARLTPRGATPTDADEIALVTSVETTAASSPTDADAAAVKTLVREGIHLLDRNDLAKSLGLCTPTFRAILELGPVQLPRGFEGGAGRTRPAAASDASEPVATELGRSEISVLAGRLAETVSLRIVVESVDALVQGEIAYGSARITAEATSKSSGSVVTRHLSCAARCVRTNGRWLVDLAIATEDRGHGAAAVRPATKPGSRRSGE